MHQASISVSAAELHGLLTGLVCGNVSEQQWQSLIYQFTNDNHAYPTSLLKDIEVIYQHIINTLLDVNSFNFELFLPKEDVFLRADGLSEWVSHFLLGLGLTQPYLDKEKGEIAEALTDLQDIAQLGYDESDNIDELNDAIEELIEYIRTVVALFHSHFRPLVTETKTVLH